jgi:hypothetical protein
VTEEKHEQKPMGIFTIAFDPEQGRFSFVGNMPLEQALAILQQALAQQARERIRRELLAEIEAGKQGQEPAETQT